MRRLPVWTVVDVAMFCWFTDQETKKPNGEAGKSAGRSDAVSSSPRGSPYDAQGGKATSAPGTDSPSGGSGGAGDGSTPAKEKIGVPIFRDECGTRRMHLAVDLGSMYRPHDVIVQVSVTSVWCHCKVVDQWTTKSDVPDMDGSMTCQLVA